ncbi:MAG: DUF1640 domain-containing protein [Nitrospirae bacterium]|nr:DUF1640 domain-containing protein [Nitrospirota bacterium]
MATVLFDTLKVVESLKSTGFSDEQARGLSEAFKVTQQTSSENLATKSDIKDLKSDLERFKLATKTDLEMVKSALELKIEQSKVDTIKWMIVFGATQAGILIAAMGLMFKFFIK